MFILLRSEKMSVESKGGFYTHAYFHTSELDILHWWFLALDIGAMTLVAQASWHECIGTQINLVSKCFRQQPRGFMICVCWVGLTSLTRISAAWSFAY